MRQNHSYNNGQQGQSDTVSKALSAIYAGIFLIDLTDDSYSTIQAGSYVLDMIVGISSAQQALNTVVQKAVVADDMTAMQIFVNLETLPERMQTKRFINTEYNGPVSGWLRGSFIEVGRDAQGKLTQVLYAYQIIEGEKRKELEDIQEMKDNYARTERSNQVKRESLEADNKLLTDQKNALTDEKQILTDANEVLTNEKQVLTDANEVLTNEKQVLTDANEVLTNEKQVLTDANEVLTNEKQILTDANEVLTNEKRVLTNANEVLTDEKRILTDENTELTHAKDAVHAIPEFGGLIPAFMKRMGKHYSVLNIQTHCVSCMDIMIRKMRRIHGICGAELFIRRIGHMSNAIFMRLCRIIPAGQIMM